MTDPKTGRRWLLRDATGEAHRRLDVGMNTFELADPSGYRSFLTVMYRSIAAIEGAVETSRVPALLPDWPERKRTAALRDDLRGQGLAPPVDDASPGLHLDNTAAALGAVYVLEGSRLGSQILLRQAQRSRSAAVTANTRFLSHGTVASMWPSFLQTLDDALRTDPMTQDAVAGALAAFALCQTVLDDHLANAYIGAASNGANHEQV